MLFPVSGAFRYFYGPVQLDWSSFYRCFPKGRTGAVVRAPDYGSSPGRCSVRGGLEQVSFTPCLVLVKPRKRWTYDRLGQIVTRLETTLCLMCQVQGT